MIAANGKYQPMIIHGDQSWVTRRKPRRTKTPGYKLVTVVRGNLHLGIEEETHLLGPGQVGFIKPYSLSSVDAFPGSHIVMVAFVVDPTGIVKSTAGNSFFHPDSSPLQPLPKSIWGFDIPDILPDKIASAVSDDIRLMSATWWIDKWGLYKAHSRLRLVLERIVSHFHDLETKALSKSELP